MEFEYDPWKSLVNADKHGIDLEAAIHTLRGSVTRLISVRRARREEISRYERKEELD